MITTLIIEDTKAEAPPGAKALRMAYGIRADGAFLVTGPDGMAAYVPHEQARIVYAVVPPEAELAWERLLRASDQALAAQHDHA